MYGIWILAIIFGIIGTVLVTLATLLDNAWKLRSKYTYKYTGESGWTDDYVFSASDGDKRRLSEEDYNKYLKQYKRYSKLYDCYTSDAEIPCGIIGGVLIVVTFGLILAAIFTPMEAAREVTYWSEFAPMVENIIEQSSGYQDVGITEKVIEYNSWLAEARSSQEIYKNFSAYYGIDLSALEYIKIGQ